MFEVYCVYDWMIRSAGLRGSELAGRQGEFAGARAHSSAAREDDAIDRSLFVLRQFEALLRPLTSEQLRELLARLPPAHGLMARWQLYTGLRVSELLRLKVGDVTRRPRAGRS